MKTEAETLSSEERFSCPLFTVFEERVRLGDGREFVRATVRHPGAVVILPQDSDGQLLLIEQYRHSVRKDILEFPAGTLETGEAPLACAKREVVEETGFKAKEWIPLGTLYPTPGFCDEKQFLFLARDLNPCSEYSADEDEVIEVVRASVKEVEDHVREDRLLDGKSLAIFLRAKVLGLI